jgi:hypothetical protein
VLAVRREQFLSAIERLALGAGMSLAATLLELVLKRRMRRRAAVRAAHEQAVAGQAPHTTADR